MFINLPVISKFEWHPFTISSAPERQDVLTFHIRSVGGWTNKLHEYFVEENRLIEDERAGRVRASEGRSMIPRYDLLRLLKVRLVASSHNLAYDFYLKAAIF